ncbi:hypothetical protein GLOIN_2v1764020 [Rhizophagus clarus]|uniref:Uncharacterized protein n=1 Tax=Rhizophagus clarus TaxID=94130 RepID=A0A8H3LDP3_9GLOM|nr:hypothetical protein GLOIN_2v1764020 [Rhizophagus clarus]
MNNQVLSLSLVSFLFIRTSSRNFVHQLEEYWDIFVRSHLFFNFWNRPYICLYWISNLIYHMSEIMAFHLHSGFIRDSVYIFQGRSYIEKILPMSHPSINVNTIKSIVSIGSTSAYNQFFIQQEFYYLFMKKCPELKYFDMRSIKHQIFYFPEAKIRLEQLCELNCDTFIDSSYFYGLSRFCQYIQKFIIVNINPKPNNGIVKLIEVQKNLKHFEWKDEFYDEYLTEDPYKNIFLALEKKANSLNHLSIYFQLSDGIENTSFQKILPKLYKLKVLIFGDYHYFTNEQLEQLKKQVYHDLEILNIECNTLDVIFSIIENSGSRLKKILFRPYDNIDLEFVDYYDFDVNSLNFIRKVYENCPSIEYLTLLFSSSKENLIEFEKLLKICQNLKSLLLVMFIRYEDDNVENFLNYGEELLKILIRSAPTNLKEIRFCSRFKFSLENLELFLEKWRGRCALSLFTNDSIYQIREDYRKLINKYKDDGVIKDFEYLRCIDY